VVTPRPDFNPQRYDFAKLGEKIVEFPTAQQQANAANVMLEQARQLADDIRSQVAEKSRELESLAEMNERLMALGDSLLAIHMTLGFANSGWRSCAVRRYRVGPTEFRYSLTRR
jgi:hypothetical protein